MAPEADEEEGVPDEWKELVSGRFSQPDVEESTLLFAHPDGWKVSQTEDKWGFWRITCSCPQFDKNKPGAAKWCEHAQDLLKSHGDVKWAPDRQETKLMDPRVMVVGIISPGIEAYFSLTDPDQIDIRAVSLVVINRKKNDTLQYTMEIPMGFIHANSGRLEIRNMLIEWLIGKTGEEYHCKSPYHLQNTSPYEKPGEFLTQRGNPGFPHLVDMYDLVTTGNCRQCNEADGIPDV